MLFCCAYTASRASRALLINHLRGNNLLIADLQGDAFATVTYKWCFTALSRQMKWAALLA